MTAAAVLVLGAVGAWAPWRAPDAASRPDGVEVRDCDAGPSTVTFSATLQPAAPGTAGGPVGEAAPQAVLSTPVFSPASEQQVGPSVVLRLRPCEAAGVEVALTASGWVSVQAQRLQAGGATVHIDDPHQLPCEEYGACGAWSGWYLTLGSAGSGSTSFTTPVRWASAGQAPGVLDNEGVLEVSVEVDGA